jgi:hypothetical protein
LVVHGNPLVIPAQAGIQDAKACVFHWVPACAGMTLREREHIKTNRSHTASLAQIEKLSCPALEPYRFRCALEAIWNYLGEYLGQLWIEDIDEFEAALTELGVH